jgi:plasmid stabilization system protein ParE
VKPFEFHPEARAEFREAASYYSTVTPELGGRFYDEIARLIGQCRETPAMYRIIHPPARRNFSRVFPYGLIFVERPDEIWILAVMHLHREPAYWTHRLGGP